jgi:DNA-binding transcriptional LysR family regulator
MNTDWLRSFVEVARRQSYSRAAERLYLSQPTVYHHVKLLEANLAVHLVQQRGKKTELTTQGKLLLDHAAHILEEVNGLQVTAQDDATLSRGQLTIGAATTFGSYLLPWLMSAFHRRHPGIELSAQIINDHEQLDELVRERRLDLAINPGGQQSDGVLKLPVLGDPMVLAVPARHAFAKLPFASPPRLAGTPLVMFPPRASFRQALEIWFAEAGVAPSVVMMLGSQESQKTAVLADAGLAILSYCTVADEVAAGRLVAIPLRPRLERHWYLSRKIAATSSHGADAFLKLLHSDTWIPAELRAHYGPHSDPVHDASRAGAVGAQEEILR